MKIHEIINELYKLQYEYGIKFQAINFETVYGINYVIIAIKKDDKIMKHMFSFEYDYKKPICLGDSDYLDFAFDRMVEEIKGETNDGERKDNC